MATNGQFYWPSVGTFVAAYGQFVMAANSCNNYGSVAGEASLVRCSKGLCHPRISRGR